MGAVFNARSFLQAPIKDVKSGQVMHYDRVSGAPKSTEPSGGIRPSTSRVRDEHLTECALLTMVGSP